MKKKPNRKKLSPARNPELRKLARMIGEFIRYWGFKAVQGEIWTYLHLSATPLSTQDLIELTQTSKGAISLALAELQEFAVIERAEAGLNGMIHYRASPDIGVAIAQVLQKRELRILENINHAFDDAEQAGAFAAEGPIRASSPAAQQLGEWIGLAQLALTHLVATAGTPDDPSVKGELPAWNQLSI